jgi:hypothetical protein
MCFSASGIGNNGVERRMAAFFIEVRNRTVSEVRNRPAPTKIPHPDEIIDLFHRHNRAEQRGKLKRMDR